MALMSGYKASRNIADSAYVRTQLSSQLVNEFVNAVELHFNDLSGLHRVVHLHC